MGWEEMSWEGDESIVFCAHRSKRGRSSVMSRYIICVMSLACLDYQKQHVLMRSLSAHQEASCELSVFWWHVFCLWNNMDHHNTKVYWNWVFSDALLLSTSSQGLAHMMAEQGMTLSFFSLFYSETACVSTILARTILAYSHPRFLTHQP